MQCNAMQCNAMQCNAMQRKGGIYVCVCMYVCMYVRMYVCMYVCTYVRTQAHLPQCHMHNARCATAGICIYTHLPDQKRQPQKPKAKLGRHFLRDVSAAHEVRKRSPAPPPKQKKKRKNNGAPKNKRKGCPPKKQQEAPQ